METILFIILSALGLAQNQNRNITGNDGSPTTTISAVDSNSEPTKIGKGGGGTI